MRVRCKAIRHDSVCVCVGEGRHRSMKCMCVHAKINSITIIHVPNLRWVGGGGGGGGGLYPLVSTPL